MAEPKIIPLAAAHPEETDPFDDLDALRVSQDYEVRGGVRKVQLSIPVGRPPAQLFFRVKPGWQYTTAFVELKVERELYLVTPRVVETLALDTVNARLHLVIDRFGNLRLWPIRLPNADGRDNTFWQSARSVAELAEAQWVRAVTNHAARGYDAHIAVNQDALGEPEWPELTQNEILKIAFRRFLIDKPDHPVIRTLRGEA